MASPASPHQPHLPRLLFPIFGLLFLITLACNIPNLAVQETPPAMEEVSTVAAEVLPEPSVTPADLSTPTAGVTPEAPHSQDNLSMTGPWVILAAQDRLWAANLDGSAPSGLVNQASTAWYIHQVALAPQGGFLSFTASWESNNLSHLSLFVAKLPEMTTKMVAELTVESTDPAGGGEMCQPSLETTRAMAVGSAMAWSPDGRSLVFIGGQDGESADVYGYSVDTEQITRLSSEPAYAFSPSWSPDGRDIVFFTANCFGTGAGFEMDDAWVVSASGAQARTLYSLPPDSINETVVGWSGPRDVITRTSSTNPGSVLRRVNLDSGQATVLFDDPFYDAAISPDGTVALVADGGTLLFTPAGDVIQIATLPATQVTYSPGRNSFFVMDMNIQPQEVSLTGELLQLMTLLEMPLFSPGGQWWASVLGSDLFISQAMWYEESSYTGLIENLFWVQDPVTGAETLFFRGGSSTEEMRFYKASVPDFTVQQVSGFTVMGGITGGGVLSP